MTSSSFFVAASATESMAALLFNGFATVFLLPIMLMDLFYFFPVSSVHLMTGKARPRILAAALSGLALWLLGLAAALGLIRILDAFAIELLYRTWSGMIGAAIGTLHTLYCMVRDHKNMREHYYARVLEKNLTPEAVERCATLRLALQNGELDAKALQNDRSMDYFTRRIARQFLAARQDLEDWDPSPQTSEIYFL